MRAFLLSAIGALLGVMTSRLGRIVDRARVLHGEAEEQPAVATAAIRSELAALSRRARLIGHAITRSTLTALLICGVIAVLFIGAFVERDVSRLVAWVFTLAMVALFFGLLVFLREILLATSTLRLDLPH